MISFSSKYRIKENISEFLFSLFLLMFSLVKPITQPTGYNGIILFCLSLLCLLVLTNHNLKRRISGNYKFLFRILSIALFLFLLDAVGRYSDSLFEHVYNFCLYAVLPIAFLSNVRNFVAVLWYYSIFSIANGFIYLFDPLLEYSISGGYMPFGFNVMLPAIAGCSLLFFYFQKKFALLLMLFFLLFSFIFSNKGATLTAILIVAMSYIYIPYGGKKSKKRLVLSLFALSLLVIMIIPLLELGWAVASHLGIDNSYALTTTSMISEGLGDNVYSERYKVWDDAIRMFNDSPLIGHGVGHFLEYSEQPYPHNFLLQVMVEYGMVGAILFIIIFIKSITKISKIKLFEKKIFTLIMLVMWFIPLMLSLAYWVYMPFWIYWALCFSRQKIANR